MATSKTVIANLALSHLGSGKEIGDLDTENSDEANTIRRFYDEALKKILEDFDWPFASKIADLTQVATNPNDEWNYSYRYPADCVRVRRILSGIRTDNRQSRIPYKISKDSGGRLIFTDLDSAKLEYTEKIETVELYPAAFVMAMSYLLAMYGAPRITGGDPFGLGPKAAENYVAELTNAKSNALNEEQPDQPTESEFVRARENLIYDDPRDRYRWRG